MMRALKMTGIAAADTLLLDNQVNDIPMSAYNGRHYYIHNIYIYICIYIYVKRDRGEMEKYREKSVVALAS